MKKVVLIQIYFGRSWPQWMPLYLVSCKYNQSVDWRIYSNIPPPDSYPSNVSFHSLTKEEFIQRMISSLGLKKGYQMPSLFFPYKLTDFKPLLGTIFSSEISQYSHFGFTDLDIVYGDLGNFLTEHMLG